MLPILSVDLMKRRDAAASEAVTAAELMRRAGEGIFRAFLERVPHPRAVAVVCGSGNNAGDGYALAGLLCDAGIPVTLFCLSEKITPTAEPFSRRCAELEIPRIPWGDGRDLSGFDVIADCILGIGFSGELREPISSAVREINRCRACGAFVLAADINSGLNGDSGMAASGNPDKNEDPLCVRSDLTVSVGAFKTGHFLNMAKDVMREKVNVDIGIDPRGEADCPPCGLFEAEDAARAFPPRAHFSNKSDYGYVALIGGSDRYSGAIRLASLSCAAMRAGAGVVKTAAPKSLCPLIAPQILEATLFPMPERDGQLAFDPDALAELTRGIRAAAFGMGAGLSEETGKIVAWLLENFGGTLVIDADGLNALGRMEDGWELLDRARGQVILTPHTMEMARLMRLPREGGVSQILRDPVAAAEGFAKEHGVTVLLKGPATVIADGERVVLVDRGCPGMATAGSGDVLSGVLAGLCGAVRDPLTAAASAAWVCGRAGELAEAEIGAVSMIAGDTVSKIPAAIRELTGEGGER